MQTLIVIVVVLAAAVFLIWRLRRNAQGHADGGCDKCGDGKSSRDGLAGLALWMVATSAYGSVVTPWEKVNEAYKYFPGYTISEVEKDSLKVLKATLEKVAHVEQDPGSFSPGTDGQGSVRLALASIYVFEGDQARAGALLDKVALTDKKVPCSNGNSGEYWWKGSCAAMAALGKLRILSKDVVDLEDKLAQAKEIVKKFQGMEISQNETPTTVSSLVLEAFWEVLNEVAPRDFESWSGLTEALLKAPFPEKEDLGARLVLGERFIKAGKPWFARHWLSSCRAKAGTKVIGCPYSDSCQMSAPGYMALELEVKLIDVVVSSSKSDALKKDLADLKALRGPFLKEVQKNAKGIWDAIHGGSAEASDFPFTGDQAPNYPFHYSDRALAAAVCGHGYVNEKCIQRKWEEAAPWQSLFDLVP